MLESVLENKLQIKLNGSNIDRTIMKAAAKFKQRKGDSFPLAEISRGECLSSRGLRLK